MPTEKEVEEKCMEDYKEHEDKFLLATFIRCFIDDNTQDFYSSEPIRVRVIKHQKQSDLINWIDNWCDPYWDVELAKDYFDEHPQLHMASSLYVDGISRNADGRVEAPKGWVLDPDQAPLTGKQAHHMPAVLTTRDREAAEAAINAVRYPKQPQTQPEHITDEDVVDLACPYCGELFRITIEKVHKW